MKKDLVKHHKKGDVWYMFPKHGNTIASIPQTIYILGKNRCLTHDDLIGGWVIERKIYDEETQMDLWNTFLLYRDTKNIPEWMRDLMDNLA